MSQDQFLTPEGAKKLRQELETLVNEKRKEIAMRLRAAIQQGDLSENADYIATKEEQGFVEGRINELEYILNRAVIIEPGNGRRETVELGVKVTLQEGEEDAEVYMLVGPSEANPREGRISHESPIGRALIGKRVGEIVTFTPPGSESIKFKIIKIE